MLQSSEYGSPPAITSAELAWQGVQVEQYHLGPMVLPAHYHTHHLLLLYQLEAPMTVRRQQGSRTRHEQFLPNDLGLYPGGEYGPIAWDAPEHNIHLLLDEQHLEHVARQGLDLAQFSLREQFRFHDPFLTQLGRQLLAAAGRRHALGLLYVESLTNALCHYLIEHHATYERRIKSGSALSGSVLTRIDAYLEASPEAPVTLETLAGLANLSVFHFARLFKQAKGMSPYQYVLRWKIRRAQQLLRSSDQPLTGISDTLGFASPASFAAAFKRAVGQTPRDFQRG